MPPIFPQTSFTDEFTPAIAGLLADTRFKHTDSKTAQDVTPFGVVVASVSGQPDQCRLPIANTGVILDDGDTWTAGDVVVVVSGVTVTTTFSTNKATSMALVATNIALLDFITSAVYDSGTDTITVVAAANVNLTLTVDVSDITGAMVITSITFTTTDDFLGIVQRGTIEGGDSRVDVNDRVVMTFAGDVLATDDTIAGSLNGVAIDGVTFATSDAVTLQLIANDFKTIAGVLDAVVDTTLRTITITNNPGLPITSAVITITDDTLASVAPTASGVFSAQGVSIGVNEAKYVPTELPPVLAQGSIWVQCEEDMTPASSVFVRIAATASFAVRGRIRTDADSGTAVAWTDAKIVGDSLLDPNGQRIVQVTINLP